MRAVPVSYTHLDVYKRQLEAISQHQSGELESEPWHLYQNTLFAMYVDYDNGKVRLSDVYKRQLVILGAGKVESRGVRRENAFVLGIDRKSVV